MHEALKKVVFISLPSSLASKIGSFTIDPAIQLPVALADDSPTVDEQSITIERIVSGMLKVLAYDPDHQHTDYYRHFVLAAQPDAANELTIAAIAQQQKGNLDFAEELFLTVCHLSPQSTTYINLATLYGHRAAEDTSKGEAYDFYQQKALNTLTEGLAFLRDDESLLREIGYFHLYQGNVEIASEYLNRYTKIAADSEEKSHALKVLEDLTKKLAGEQRLMQAYDAIQMNKEEEALSLLDHYLADHPRVWNAYFLKGWALRRLERFSEAQDALIKALEIESHSSDIYNELALCALEAGEEELAKNYLGTALDLDEENITFMSNLAYLHLRSGELEEARHLLEEARALDAEDPLIQQLMEDYIHQSGDRLGNVIVEEYVEAEEIADKLKHGAKEI